MSQAAMDYLTAHELLFLATASKTGNPHVAPMFYAAEGTKIYFSAPDGSETAENLRQNPIAEVAVAEMPEEWAEARGLQIEGPVTELDGEEETHAGKLFQARYPFLGDNAMHTHYWRLDAVDIRHMYNGSAKEGGGDSDESHQSLGQTWGKDKVEL
jgi:nitroimidazol reductase NimA-like FMN-containing flavoprotein (pyridoxamine 5'-phosphate oxidase superfamily)